MNITFSILRVGLIALIGFIGLNAQPVDGKPLYENLDQEVFFLVKKEFENTKKILIEIRDSQNPALAKQAFNFLGTSTSNLMYMLSAIFLGGGAELLGTILIVGPDNVQQAISTPQGVGIALMCLPALIIPILITYKILKWMFEGSNNKGAIDIKAALSLIDQTINKIDYELMKMDRLARNFQK